MSFDSSGSNGRYWPALDTLPYVTSVPRSLHTAAHRNGNNNLSLATGKHPPRRRAPVPCLCSTHARALARIPDDVATDDSASLGDGRSDSSLANACREVNKPSQ